MMSTFIYLLIEIFIILDCDTAPIEEKAAKPQSERKQLGKIVKIVICVLVSLLSKMRIHIARYGHIVYNECIYKCTMCI